MWRATVLTIFPEMFPGPLGVSLAGKALQKGVWALDAVDIRDHAPDKHRTVDDTPAGGGPGMVMKADVLARAIDFAAGNSDGRPRLLLSPRGTPLTQRRIVELAGGPGAVVLCGRGEGARRGLARRFRALRRRNRRVGADRRLRPASARRHGQRGLRHRGELR